VEGKITFGHFRISLQVISIDMCLVCYYRNILARSYLCSWDLWIKICSTKIELIGSGLGFLRRAARGLS
jgi:hypothetical protein